MVIEADGCQYDYLEISFATGPMVDRLCGDLSDTSETSWTGSGPVDISFISDGSVEPGLGFSMSYKVDFSNFIN